MTDLQENTPAIWRKSFPFPTAESHKYSRGSALIRGGPLMTGATRLAARAAQRVGAGLVTLAAPTSALFIYAESLESVIVRPCDTREDWQKLIDNEHHPALLMGPGLGLLHPDEILASLAARRPTVLDADALTAFSGKAETLFRNLHAACVLTPHEGEFTRLFGPIDGDKITRARQAAQRAGCTILLKGAETIIAAPDGAALINRTSSPWLATAGSGDVLAGIILGLVAQKMDPFLAAASAAWLHGRIGTQHGPGLIAEDIVAGIPAILQEIIAVPAA